MKTFTYLIFCLFMGLCIALLMPRFIDFMDKVNQPQQVTIHLYLETAPGTSIYMERKTYELKTKGK